MLACYQPKTKIVEKIYTQADGRWIRVLFLVALVNGELKVKPISAQAIEEIVIKEAPIAFLPAEAVKSSQIFRYVPTYAPVVSPYSLLNFFTSQPTRAPSIV